MSSCFVDVQVNGWMGVSFSDNSLTPDGIRRVTSDLVARGTRGYCPTVITGPEDIYKRNLGLLADAIEQTPAGRHLLGIHMEGPFISPAPGARGAHSAQYVRPPSAADFDRYQDWARGHIVLLTLDPEQPGAEALIRHAGKQGVVVSLGHHFAPDEALERAVRAGARAATHVGNGIPNQIPRHQNPLWWQLASDDLMGLFITDGHHLPPPLIKVALRAKTPGRFIVTSDASPLAGMPPGRYTVFGLPVAINEAGRIYSEQTQTLAGSHSTMLECMNFLAGLQALSESDLWQVGQRNALALLGRSPEDIENLPGPKVVFDGGIFRVLPAE